MLHRDINSGKKADSKPIFMVSYPNEYLLTPVHIDTKSGKKADSNFVCILFLCQKTNAHSAKTSNSIAKTDFECQI